MANNLPKLLVPMQVDAFVVVNDTTPKVKDIRLDYNNDEHRGALGKYWEKIIPAKTPEMAKELYGGQGVHLHWTLPKVFRSGTHNEKENQLDFPLIPNRWLVVRLPKDKKNGKLWVIESDFIGEEDETPNWAEIKNNTLKLSRLGQYFDFENWQESKPTASQFLTMMAPGNPAFAAAYIHSKDILGFHDKLEGVGNEVELSYNVFGWYANPAADLLNEVKDIVAFKKILENLDCELQDIDTISANEIPKSILCHAAIYSVNVLNGKYNERPSSGSVKIGIGNSVSEAMAALTKNSLDTEGMEYFKKYLASFQYKSMEENGLETDTNGLLKNKMHQRSFYSVEGGTRWVIEPPEKQEGFEQKEADDMKAFSPVVSGLLTQLNILQEKYDALIECLKHNQAELYAAQYKLKYLYLADSFEIEEEDGPAINSKLTISIKSLKEVIRDTNTEIITYKKQKQNASTPNFPQDYEGTLVTTYNALVAELQKTAETKSYQLKEVKMPPYYQPNDPSIVINGLRPDERYTNNDKTLCRIRKQVPTSIDNIENKSCDSSEIISMFLADGLSSKIQSNLSAEIVLLIQESLLFNPFAIDYISRDISAKANKDKSEIIPIVTQAMNKPSKTNYEGVLNNKSCTFTWKQPWIPLYMEWGGVAGANRTAIYGRVLLSSTMINKIKELSNKIKELSKKITDSSNLFQTIKPMTQELSGFGNALIGRYNGIQLPIFNFDEEEEQFILDADNSLLGSQLNWQPIPEQEGFYPLRELSFKFTKLRIIDAFGQILDVVDKDIPNLSSIDFYQSSALARNANNEYMLSTRLPQAARLRFDWLSANPNHEKARITNSDIASNPVCGWLLLNKLDNCIDFFDTDGKDIGELTKVGDTLKFMDIYGKEVEIEQDIIRGIVEGIKTAAAPQKAFDNFWRQIENLNQNITARASKQSFIMGVPVGFPIAIARASCKIELQRPFVKPLSWKPTESQAAWENEEFACFLGEGENKFDGLVGYFQEGAYNQLRLPNVSLPFKLNQTYNFVLLLDPRMSVRVATDILPQASYELPQNMIKKTLENINLGFLTAPIISPTASLKVPLAELNGMQWQWLSPTKAGENGNNEIEIKIPDTNTKGGLTFETIQAVEGWLKLVRNDNKE